MNPQAQSTDTTTIIKSITPVKQLTLVQLEGILPLGMLQAQSTGISVTSITPLEQLLLRKSASSVAPQAPLSSDGDYMDVLLASAEDMPPVFRTYTSPKVTSTVTAASASPPTIASTAPPTTASAAPPTQTQSRKIKKEKMGEREKLKDKIEKLKVKKVSETTVDVITRCLICEEIYTKRRDNRRFGR